MMWCVFDYFVKEGLVCCYCGMGMFVVKFDDLVMMGGGVQMLLQNIIDVGECIFVVVVEFEDVLVLFDEVKCFEIVFGMLIKKFVCVCYLEDMFMVFIIMWLLLDVMSKFMLDCLVNQLLLWLIEGLGVWIDWVLQVVFV